MVWGSNQAVYIAAFGQWCPKEGGCAVAQDSTRRWGRRLSQVGVEGTRVTCSVVKGPEIVRG